MDLKRLYNVFVDEAFEKIAELEEGLLQLEKTPDDKDLLNNIFRAAHTIKGNSATVGLYEISRFTHKLEEILDLLRGEIRVPDKGLIDILLEATDQLRVMVESVASEGSFDPSRSEKLIEKMESLKEETAEKEYRISFTPAPDLLLRGINPAFIFEDLKKEGRILSINADIERVPRLSELNPEELYLRWDILYRTEQGIKEIEDLFEFARFGSELDITTTSAFPSEVSPTERGPLTVCPEEEVELKEKRKEKEREATGAEGEKGVLFTRPTLSTIRVDLKKLDYLMNMVGEMIITHSMFQEVITDEADSIPERLKLLFPQLLRIGREIQESVMSLRMIPVGELFHRFKRVVRELSDKENKEIELKITGEETELDKGIIDRIYDPLVHIIRNAIDHGIETPDVRKRKGKPMRGTIHLSAYQTGDSVYIEIIDDGKGIKKEEIFRKALSKGLINDSAEMSDAQIFNLLFTPGFTTSEKVTDVSGRGVGLDVVKRDIESLNGKVYINTEEDAGTTIGLKLPLTLAIIDGLTVLIGDDVFIIPVTSVIESIRPRMEDVKTVSEKGEVINVRGEYIPLIRLYEHLGLRPRKKNPWEAIVVIVSSEKKKFCFMVDELLGEQQTVLKNLGTALPRLTDISGGTILGNGRVALVLDVSGIIETAKKIPY
jgi:two-component system chemotaxis sensor kinase CheA